MTNMIFKAMTFAMHAHRGQKRKYTGNPYFEHLAEVAGLTSSVASEFGYYATPMLCVSYLHDYIEDICPSYGEGWYELKMQFDVTVADCALLLSNPQIDSRAERKLSYRKGLAGIPAWLQTVKCADIISNSSSIVLHDPKFALSYLEEKRKELEVLANAHAGLLKIANDIVSQGLNELSGATSNETNRGV